jgi:hypothetical protein
MMTFSDKGVRPLTPFDLAIPRGVTVQPVQRVLCRRHVLVQRMTADPTALLASGPPGA